MKRNSSSTKRYWKLATLVLVTNISATPFLLPQLAYAKPDKNKGRIGDITIAGVVTRDTPGNDFYVRSDDGDRFLVVTVSQPDGVTTGVRVKVSGYYDGNQISASDVGILTKASQSRGESDGMRNITGVVSRDPAGDDFYVLSDDGRTYLVITKSQPREVQTGVRVRVVGWYDGNHLNANNVDVLSNSTAFNRDQYGYNPSGTQMTITGTVTRDTPGNDFYVRTDSGDKYLVITLKQPRKIESGVRVRVRGWNNGNQISANADDIQVLGSSAWDSNSKQGYLDVKGIVTRDPKGNDFFIHSDDDRTYMVITKSQAKGVKSGARVRVKGWYDGDHLNANDVDVLDKGKGEWSTGLFGSLEAYKNKYVTLVGTVDRLTKNNSFYLRESLGMTYLVVTLKQPDDLEVGERVQVFGYYNGSVLTSNKQSIKILD